ncbi:MAG: hypothetical protein GY787_25495 [Alteromonadales bacterium]|nr:hypothetical protein [Alteromonadales bacterium]
MQEDLNNLISIKKIARLISTTCVALAIHGCSSTVEDEGNEQPMTPEQQQQYMLEKIESWSAAEPDIQRILGLESDMQLIINQLASMAELDDDPLESDKEKNKESANSLNTQNDHNPAEQSLNASTSTVNAQSNNSDYAQSDNSDDSQSSSSISNQAPTNSLAKMNNNVNRASRSMGHYFPKVGIHIGMFKDINNIPVGWKYLQSMLPKEIINKNPLVSKINYENTEYYSLRVGPFKSANSAKSTCISLQQQQHYCSVVEYKGFSLSLNAK